jgi:recombination protein RecR
MEYSSRLLSNLIDEFARLPSIGRKTAQRLAFHILKVESEEALRLSRAIQEVKANVRYCAQCGNIAESETCLLCADTRRAADIVCVVEQPSDVVALEKTGQFRGLYHVLHGSIAPLEGKGPDDINLASLLARVRAGVVREVILATNPNVSGEATAMYISQLLQPLHIQVSRIARGIPMGSDLEYSDQSTLARALEGRQKMD